MTICAVALVDAMPSNRTSIGAALNDTAQEVGTSIGTAVVGTLIAVLVTTALPAGTWSSDLVASFFHGERITYAVLAVVVGLVAAAGALRSSASRARPAARASHAGGRRRRAGLHCRAALVPVAGQRVEFRLGDRAGLDLRGHDVAHERALAAARPTDRDQQHDDATTVVRSRTRATRAAAERGG